MQVPLNDESEYVGGKLVFVNGNCKISVPSRPAGSYIQFMMIQYYMVYQDLIVVYDMDYFF